MDITRTVETFVENNFRNESISVQEIVAYITQSEVFFGICEESEDLTELHKSYER